MDDMLDEEGDFAFVRSMGNGVDDTGVQPRVIRQTGRRKDELSDDYRDWAGPQIRDFREGDDISSHLAQLLGDSAIRPPPHVAPRLAPVWTSSIAQPAVPEQKPEGWFRRLWRSL
jgi:hypothetical protein